MEHADLLADVRDALRERMRIPVSFEDLIMHNIHGFSFIINGDDVYVRLSMANDFNACTCRDSESWFAQEHKFELQVEVSRCLAEVCAALSPSTNLACCLEITGACDTWAVSIDSVRFSDDIVYSRARGCKRSSEVLEEQIPA